LMVRLMSDAALAAVVADLVDADGETMTAPELMHINRDMRLRFQTTLTVLRQADGAGMEDAGYTAIEAVRETAGRLNAMIAAAINQKPPLLVRPAPINGTMHQIAHEFYGDLNRADELIRLNPHIVHPAFVKRDTLVNLYAK
jgi:putative phage virion protein